MPACSSDAWRECQQALEELNQQLQRAVRAFPVERLLQQLGSEYTAYTQFAGAPQHDAYHAGQIAILKKALAASRGAA
jgi:hypothetical protein